MANYLFYIDEETIKNSLKMINKIVKKMFLKE